MANNNWTIYQDGKLICSGTGESITCNIPKNSENFSVPITVYANTNLGCEKMYEIWQDGCQEQTEMIMYNRTLSVNTFVFHNNYDPWRIESSKFIIRSKGGLEKTFSFVLNFSGNANCWGSTIPSIFAASVGGVNYQKNIEYDGLSSIPSFEETTSKPELAFASKDLMKFDSYDIEDDFMFIMNEPEYYNENLEEQEKCNYCERTDIKLTRTNTVFTDNSLQLTYEDKTLSSDITNPLKIVYTITLLDNEYKQHLSIEGLHNSLSQHCQWH